MSLPPLGLPRRPTREDRNRTIRSTDTDALHSRLSAVTTHYLTDPYIWAFTTHTPSTAPRKLPLINLGTYLRTTALDLLITRFLTHPFASPHRQIISLGAGSDTRFFRLAAQHPALVYHELDFAEVTRGKIASVQRDAALRGLLRGDVEVSAEELHAGNYHVHAVDVRELCAGRELRGVRADVPTLCVSECCLVYLEPGEADAVFGWCAGVAGEVGMVVYEPMDGNGDQFGRVMVRNLAQRGIVLRTLEKYGGLDAQKERFRALGFAQGQGAVDVEFVRERWVEERERERVRGLEMWDEVEEWVLLARHYCVAWGWKGSGWEGWTDGLESQV